MINVMKKMIPFMLALIIVLAGIVLFIMIKTHYFERGTVATPSPKNSPIEIASSTPGQESAPPTDTPEPPEETPVPTIAPTEPPTATPEPTFSAIVDPVLSGAEIAGSIKVTVKDGLIDAKYPYNTKETDIAKLRLEIGGENISNVSCQTEGFAPWQTYPVTVTDKNGLTEEFSFRLTPDGKNIPVVSIYTDGPVDSRIDYVGGTIYIDGDNTEDYAGKNLGGASLKIRGRGNASWEQTEKKSYRIKLDEKASVLGLKKNKDWVLVSNHFDKSLLRNVVAHTMAQKMDYLYYTPTHILVDFFLNGKYMGVYAICDKIEEAKSKVNIYNGTAPDEPGFFIEIGWDYSHPYVRDRDYFDTDIIIRLFVKEPEITSANNADMLYIKNYIKKAEQAMVAGKGYEEYIDVDNFVDWFIIAELTNNTEMAFYRSCYFYKPEGGKLTLGPVWDFDMAFGNHSDDIKNYDGWATAEATYWLVNDTWMTYLVKDPAFMEKVRTRWLQVRDVLLETAMSTIDRQYALVADSAELNFKVWDILGKQIGIGAVDYKIYNTYEKQVDYLRQFITTRAAYIDKRLGTAG